MRDGVSQFSDDVNHNDHTLSLDHLLQNIDSAPSQKSGTSGGIGSFSSSDKSSSLHKDSHSYIDNLFRGDDEEDTRDVVEYQESKDSTRDDSTADDVTGGDEECSEEDSFIESFDDASFRTPHESYSVSMCTEDTTEDDADVTKTESFDTCSIRGKDDKLSQVYTQSSHVSVGTRDCYPYAGSAKSSKSDNPFKSSNATDVLYPSVDSSSCDASHTRSHASKSHASSYTKAVDNKKNSSVEANISAILAAASSNVSSVEETAKWSSVSKASHANDILVEIEAFTVESRHLMNRPGLRCPVSLPIPISTIGVNCIGRVVDSSAHSALHGITFRDRVAAIYPFEYEKKRIWNKEEGGCAYVDAGFAINIPKHIDAAEASTLLHVYTPVFQSIQAGITHSGRSNADDKYSLNQLKGQSILIQNGHTNVGLAFIELALGLGAEYVFVPASCIHHSMLTRAGATPLGLVENDKDSSWENWKMLQEKKNVSLVILQEMPSISMLDMFESILGEAGSIVFAGPEQGGKEEENTSSVNNYNSGYSYDQLLDVVEKARIEYEKVTLEHRLASSPRLVKYCGVISSIVDNPLAWKKDVTFLINLLAGGTLKPRVHDRIYSRQDVSNAQKNNEMHDKNKSIVCLPLKKWSNDKLRASSSEVLSCYGVSLRTRKESFAVTEIAKVWRKFACRRTYKCAIDAARRVDELIDQRRDNLATVIQTKWRAYRAKKWFDDTISDIVSLQYLCRKWLASCQLQLLRKEKYRKDAGASTKIAAAWRKELYQRKYSRTLQGAIIIQSCVRRKSAIKTLDLMRAKKREEFAKQIEAEWQARVATRRRNKVLISMRVKAYSEEASAIAIQNSWRGHFAQRNFCVIRYYVTIIQAFVRKCIACGEFNRNIQAAVTCQSVIRMHLAIENFGIMNHKRNMSRARTNLLSIKCSTTILRVMKYFCSAIVLQRAIRGWIVRSQYKKNIQDITRCQYSVMKYLAVKRANRFRNKKITEKQDNAILIQSFVRATTPRNKYLAKIRAAIKCQRAIRSKLAVQKMRNKKMFSPAKAAFHKIKACSVILQVIKYRSSAVTIQMATRCMFARNELSKKKARALHDLAEFWRHEAALTDKMNKTHNSSKCRHSAARRIQAAYKCTTKHCNQVRFAAMRNSEDVMDPFKSVNEKPNEAEGLLESMIKVEDNPKDEPKLLVVGAEHSSPDDNVVDHAVCSPSSIMSDMAKSMQEALSDCMTRPMQVTSRGSDLTNEGSRQILSNSCYLDSESCFIVDDAMISSQFSPTSYISDMAESIQNVFSDCVAKTAPAAEEVRGEIREIIESRLKGYGHTEEEKPKSADNSPSFMSGLEETEAAEFVSAVVVIQTYLHEINEMKNVNAELTQMDSFEFEHFYKDMLYGVDDPKTALKQIVKCQSVARKIIALRKTQNMQEACGIVLRHTNGGMRS